MRRKNISNRIIRESITEALLILMQTEHFSEITVSELTKKAGVGRVSFYRNYHSKEEVLLSYMSEQSHAWWQSFKADESDDYIESFLAHCQNLKPFCRLLESQGLEHLLLESIRSLIGPKPDDNVDSAYKKACLCGCVYGVATEWLKRDMADTPKEISRVLSVPKSVLKGFMDTIEF